MRSYPRPQSWFSPGSHLDRHHAHSRALCIWEMNQDHSVSLVQEQRAVTDEEASCLVGLHSLGSSRGITLSASGRSLVCWAVGAFFSIRVHPLTQGSQISDSWNLYLRVTVLYQKDLSGDGSNQTPVTAMDNDFIMIPINCNGFFLATEANHSQCIDFDVS